MKISAIVLTENEKKDIERCLKSIDFCNEKIIIKADINDFAQARNLAMKKTKYDWILFIDDDEEVTSDLREEMKSLVITNRSNKSYYIKRRDFFWGREMRYGETRKLRNNGMIRLIKKNSGKWIGKVHEEFKTSASTSRLKYYLNHYPHQTLKEFIEDINHYSGLRADELYHQGKKFNLLELILFPLFKFILVYFIYLGFLDGPSGFIYAFLMSFHSFLVRAKLFQLEAEKRG